MNILICDDMRAESERLAGFINDLDRRTDTVTFDSGKDALAHYLSGAAVDVCFLDIIMPKMNGIELAQKLRGAGFAGEIVFISTSHEYGPETYDVNAFSYLLKPPTAESVRKVFDKLERARTDTDTDGIMVKTKRLAKFLRFRDIACVEVIQHYVHFRLTNGDEIAAYASLMEIAPRLLSDERFVQCHQSFIINMDAISAISRKEIAMQNKAKVPISKSYSDIKGKYLEWITRGE